MMSDYRTPGEGVKPSRARPSLRPAVSRFDRPPVAVASAQVRRLTERRCEPDPAQEHAKEPQIRLAAGILDIPVRDPLRPLVGRDRLQLLLAPAGVPRDGRRGRDALKRDAPQKQPGGDEEPGIAVDKAHFL